VGNGTLNIDCSAFASQALSFYPLDSLDKHYHFMVLAFATFLVAFAAFICVPIVTFYIVECFPTHAFEASITMGFYRLIFELAVPFFVSPWSTKVGVGWVFGMAALFSIFMALMVLF